MNYFTSFAFDDVPLAVCLMMIEFCLLFVLLIRFTSSLMGTNDVGAIVGIFFLGLLLWSLDITTPLALV